MTAPTLHVPHVEHEHVHGDGCGHRSITHADHVEYVHDGHLHRPHDGHVDDCELAAHADAEHDTQAHNHGEGCGHDPVPHGDHVDFLHDGHRHAAHGEHYDEH